MQIVLTRFYEILDHNKSHQLSFQQLPKTPTLNVGAIIFPNEINREVILVEHISNLLIIPILSLI